MNFLSAPIYVGIDLTKRCNLECIHCRADASWQDKTELELPLLKDLLQELSNMGVIQIILSGGEPFIRRDIFEIISHTIKLKIPDVAVVSNGTILSDKIIKRLTKTGLKKIICSIDGLREANDVIRGKGNFEKAIKAVKMLVDEGFNVGISMTINKLNKKDFVGLTKLGKKIGVKTINAGNLMPCGRGKEFWNKSLNHKERSKLFKHSKILKRRLGHKFLTFESSFLCKPKLEESDKKIIPFLGCRGGRTACAILSNGDIVACKMLPHIVSGNIYRKSFKEIWENSKNWKVFRDDSLKGKCKVCKIGPACRGGCKAMAYFKYGRLDLPDPRCNGPFNDLSKGLNKI